MHRPGFDLETVCHAASFVSMHRPCEAMFIVSGDDKKPFREMSILA